MGKVSENIITKGFRGKYNEDLVFRRLDNHLFKAVRQQETANSQPAGGEKQVQPCLALLNLNL